MIEFIKIEIKFNTDNDKHSFFIGSLLRGVVGHALKKTTCINPSFQCDGCFAVKDCIYYKFYEDKNAFHKYRFDVSLGEKNLDFSFYIFEDAISSLPYLLSSFKKAFEEIGVGRERKVLKINQIIIDNLVAYDGCKFLSLEKVKPKTVQLDRIYQDVIIKFNMPLRIKENNNLARKTFKLHTLINSIHHRYKHLKSDDFSQLGYKVKGEIVDSNLKFVELQRYSNRQKSKMNMGGLMGSITVKGLDKQSYVYLKIGEIIGVGKQTVFGLGKIKVEGINE